MKFCSCAATSMEQSTGKSLASKVIPFIYSNYHNLSSLGRLKNWNNIFCAKRTNIWKVQILNVYEYSTLTWKSASSDLASQIKSGSTGLEDSSSDILEWTEVMEEIYQQINFISSETYYNFISQLFKKNIHYKNYINLIYKVSNKSVKNYDIYVYTD